MTKKKSKCVLERYARVTGFMRPVRDWNPGKVSEFEARKHYKLGEKKEDSK